mgnify:CR=1 FL=1
MSTHLAIGAVAALAGLAAASSRGARTYRWAGPPRPEVFRVWHQTTPEAEAAIRVQGFRIDLPLARRSDHEMPDGVFLKFHDRPIGVVRGVVMAPSQMLVEVRVSGVLRVADRAHLSGLLRRDDAYQALLYDREQLDRDYTRTVDDLEAKTDEIYRRVWERAQAARQDSRRVRVMYQDDPELHAADQQAKAAIEEWGRLSHEKSTLVRERGTDLLRELGYDSVLMERDEGSGGRTVRTLVVLDPENVTPLDRP